MKNFVTVTQVLANKFEVEFVNAETLSRVKTRRKTAVMSSAF